MLYPAQLYKEELKNKLTEYWYNPKYQFYFVDCQREFEVPKSAEERKDLVHLDKDGNIDGYFSYFHNKPSRSLTNFGLMSFRDNNVSFIRDVIRHMDNLWKNKAVRRIEFWAFADNPAVKGYSNIIARYDGYIAATLKETEWFDGKYHDTIIFEMLQD